MQVRNDTNDTSGKSLIRRFLSLVKSVNSLNPPKADKSVDYYVMLQKELDKSSSMISYKLSFEEGITNKERLENKRKENLTGKVDVKIIQTTGETEVHNAGKQTARDSRSGFWHKTSEGTEPVPFSL